MKDRRSARLATGRPPLLHARADRLRSELDETAQQLRNLLVEHRSVLRWNGHRATVERATYRSC